MSGMLCALSMHLLLLHMHNPAEAARGGPQHRALPPSERHAAVPPCWVPVVLAACSMAAAVFAPDLAQDHTGIASTSKPSVTDARLLPLLTSLGGTKDGR
jgi:hypothetical protein